MKFSVNWLRQWVRLDMDARKLADRLTAAGLEVETIEPVAADFSNVVVAEIEACRAHPDADKLSVCSVNDGSGQTLQIVCGAPNARAGIRVPLARVGASIGPDFKIKAARLRGVESAGMLCSARELGLSDDHSGLLQLPADAPVGEDLRQFLALDDCSIEIDLTPNRADCLSIRGLARDVAAICATDFMARDIPPVAARIDDRLPIRLEQPQDCPRYAARVIRNIDPAATTPLWMREALRRCGVRSISPVVDVTNYVLLELGQPMHAFDLDRVQREIIVRRGRSGEKLLLLDGSEVELDTDVLAICDAGGPLALAGIMGGAASAVTESTHSILLESAWFKPATIMGKARAYGLHTDASHRFERGVDPQAQVQAIEHATALILDICGGAPGPVLLAEEPQWLPCNQPIHLRHDRLQRIIGLEFERTVVVYFQIRNLGGIKYAGPDKVRYGALDIGSGGVLREHRTNHYLERCIARPPMLRPIARVQALIHSAQIKRCTFRHLWDGKQIPPCPCCSLRQGGAQSVGGIHQNDRVFSHSYVELFSRCRLRLREGAPMGSFCSPRLTSPVGFAPCRRSECETLRDRALRSLGRGPRGTAMPVTSKSVSTSSEVSSQH